MTTDIAPASPMMELQSKSERKKPGRKSNEERARIAEERERRARRARPLPVDTRVTLAVTLVIATSVILAAFTVSYFTMVAVAGWMRLPAEVAWLAYAVPGFIELLVIFSTFDYILTKTRQAAAWGPYWAMVGFSAIAVLGNAAHSIQAWGSAFGLGHWESLIGVILSALAPLVVVYVAKRVTALVFEHPEES